MGRIEIIKNLFRKTLSIMKIIDLEKLQTINFNFENIILKIKDLLMRTTYRVMIPFGSLCYISGEIVNTNEFIVQIGGNIYISMSAYQVISFLRRRQKSIIEKINKRKKTLTNLREVIDHYEPPKLKNITSVKNLKKL